MAEPIHSYPFYITDWRESGNVLSMTAEQRDVYRNLLDMCWRDGSLPTSELALQKLSLASEKEFRNSWPVVRQMFEERDGRLYNSKVDDKRPDILKAKEDRKRGANSANAKRTAQRALSGQSANAKRALSEAPAYASDADIAGDSASAERTPPPSPSPSPSPCSLTLTARVGPVIDNSPPAWKIDEVFVEFQEKYNSTGGAFIDEDYTEAFRYWNRLRPDQRMERLASLAKHFEEYRLDPRYAPRPLKFLDSEWKRPVKPSPAGAVEYDYGR